MPLKHPLTKLYYTIGEVAAMFDVNTSLIRFWEKEFPQLNPGKNSSGIRKYTKKDVEIFNKIYHLLKEEGYTIDGAKKHFKDTKLDNEFSSKTLIIYKLQNLKSKLVKMRSVIDKFP